METLVRRDVLRIALEADCDPRTVEGFLRGDRGYRGTRARIVRAIRRLGLDAHLPRPELAKT